MADAHLTSAGENGEPDDTTLLAACRSKTPSANRSFTLLVRRYEPRVYRTCLRMLGNEADAEDVMQEVFVKVFRKLNAFEGRSSFSTWLFTITRNECLTAISKRASLPTYAADAFDEELVPSGDALPTDRLEQADLLEKALARLKPEDREVLVTRFVSGLRIEEVADVLDLSLSAAKMRLYRAMERFRAAAGKVTAPGRRDPG